LRWINWRTWDSGGYDGVHFTKTYTDKRVLRLTKARVNLNN
jgi:hypothetical protein